MYGKAYNETFGRREIKLEPLEFVFKKLGLQDKPLKTLELFGGEAQDTKALISKDAYRFWDAHSADIIPITDKNSKVTYLVEDVVSNIPSQMESYDLLFSGYTNGSHSVIMDKESMTTHLEYVSQALKLGGNFVMCFSSTDDEPEAVEMYEELTKSGDLYNHNIYLAPYDVVNQVLYLSGYLIQSFEEYGQPISQYFQEPIPVKYWHPEDILELVREVTPELAHIKTGVQETGVLAFVKT